MNMLSEISAQLVDAKVEQICVGTHWTAVVVEREGELCCGLASNPVKGEEARQGLEPVVAELKTKPAIELCALAVDHPVPLTSIGLAAINALLPNQPERWVEKNAGDVIAEKGQGKRVALVGHFPFVPYLREQVGHLDVLELRPREGDLNADMAPKVIPQADVVAITSMAFVNGTMEGLLALCAPEAYVIVLGPSTPLSPILFDAGADVICGSYVESIDPVVESILAGDSFRQVKKQGVRLVTIEQ